ncbi:hypothetical protein Q4S41_18160 [Hymenobacter sp. CA1UV-4]|nr:hypothetical protein [Hymenobacter sp. CA1UV-4]MDO7853533.1 hypothetical protein [Hymenobacter sp. CA1UV-4]
MQALEPHLGVDIRKALVFFLEQVAGFFRSPLVEPPAGRGVKNLLKIALARGQAAAGEAGQLLVLVGLNPAATAARGALYTATVAGGHSARFGEQLKSSLTEQGKTANH